MGQHGSGGHRDGDDGHDHVGACHVQYRHVFQHPQPGGVSD